MKKYFFASLFLGLCSFNTMAAPTLPRKVLVVISAASRLQLQDGTTREVGFYLNELTVPLKQLVDAGYDPVFVTPNGAMPHLDPASDDPKYFGGSLETYKMYKSFLGNLHLLDAAHSTVQNIDAFKSYDFTDYAAIFVPGGHAPMVDLIENRSLGAILRIFHSLNKLTALICHGPVSLISALDNPSQFVQALRQGDQAMARQLSDAWIYKGCEMTVFSDAEDANAEAKKFHGKMLYYPQDALAAAGGNMSEGSPGQSHIIQCGELLTGQNPQSDSELAERMVQLLKSR